MVPLKKADLFSVYDIIEYLEFNRMGHDPDDIYWSCDVSIKPFLLVAMDAVGAKMYDLSEKHPMIKRCSECGQGIYGEKILSETLLGVPIVFDNKSDWLILKVKD